MSLLPPGPSPTDARRENPSAERNKRPLLEVLRRVFPSEGLVLELASGTGQHAAFFTDQLPSLHWQPTDVDAHALPSIAAWRQASHPDRIRAPLLLDATADAWPVPQADAMLCVNMLQVSPWPATLGLLAGAARTLTAGGPLVIYSPMSRGGVHISPGNAAFDANLKSHDPRLGVRDADLLIEAATAAGLTHAQTVDMPANNTVLVFRR